MSRRRCFKKETYFPYTLLDLGYDEETANWYKEEFDIYGVSRKEYLKSVDLTKRYNPSYSGALQAHIASVQNTYLPKLDVSNLYGYKSNNCLRYYKFPTIKIIPDLDFTFTTYDSSKPGSRAYKMLSEFENLIGIRKVTIYATILDYTLCNNPNLKKVECFDWQPTGNPDGYNTISIYDTSFANNNSLQYIYITNLHKITTSSLTLNIPEWGAGSEKNRQSLVDTFITNFNYAEKSINFKTIKLPTSVVERFTAEEIAYITNQGMTITGI
jgi:hypothetical protein